MFKEARARRAWLLYFLKAEAVLSPLSTTVRRELIEDLQAHVRDILANEPSGGDEFARLQAALERVGNPREFLAPLLADAVFRAPPRHGSFGMAYRTLALYAARGTTYFVRAMGLVVAAAVGFGVTLVALNSLIRPDRAGVFQLNSEEYQVRIVGFGSNAGEQMLTPWMAVLLIALGLAVIAWGARRARKMLTELIASAA
jgi:hypothetical protein